MIFRFWVLLGLFLGCVSGFVHAIPAANPVPLDPSVISALKDSIIRLDSLVQKSKNTNSVLALKYAQSALAHAKKLNTAEAVLTGYRLMGQTFYQKNKDSSFIYYNRALKLADSAGLNAPKPFLFYSCGLLYYFAKDYQTAIILMDSCIETSRSQKDYSRLSDAYNELGNINMDVRNRDLALIMYDSANQIARRHGMNEQIGTSLGNLARFEKDPVKSIRLAREAVSYLRKCNRTGAKGGLANIYINIGYSAKHPDTALYYFHEALKIAGVANLSEIKIAAFNNMVYSYLEKGNLVEAEKCMIDSAIPIALKEKNDDWLATLYDTYADVLVRKGDYQEAFKWQKAATEKRISDEKSQASEQARLLSVLLDVKSKDFTIQDKQKQILAQENRLQKTRLGLTITIFMILGFILLILWLQQRNRSKLQHQQITSAKRIIEMEENEKDRTARELHDITGQLVLGITSEIENLDIPSSYVKDQIKGKIKELGKSIRLISHRMNKATLETFTFEELIEGQCEDIRKVVGLNIRLEMPEPFGDLPEEIVLHVYRIIQELLTNASKYAKESLVRIEILKKENAMGLNYQDDGPGFAAVEIEKKGMGLGNIFERTKLLNGTAQLTSSPGTGTKWEILIPLSPEKTQR